MSDGLRVATDPARSEAQAEPQASVVAAPSTGRRRRRASGRRGLVAASRLLPFLFLGGLWELASRAEWVDPFFLPPLSTVTATLWDQLVVTGELWSDVSATTYRAGMGLLLGTLAGALLGLLMGEIKLVRHFLEPVISFTFPMPKLALLPLLIVFLGIGDASKIAMVTLGAFFPMVVNTLAGVTSVNRVLIWNASTLGAGRLQIARTVVFPAALPHIFSGFRIATGTAFLLVVASEMVTANDGLGYQIVFSQRNFRPDIMMAGILVVAILGFLIDRLLTALSKRLLAWQDTGRA